MTQTAAHEAAVTESEVIIVGAGPAGLMLANILGMYERSVVVLESRETLIDYPRGVGLDDEIALRVADRVGGREVVVGAHRAEHDAAGLAPQVLGMDDDLGVGRVGDDERLGESERVEEASGGGRIGDGEAVEQPW